MLRPRQIHRLNAHGDHPRRGAVLQPANRDDRPATNSPALAPCDGTCRDQRNRKRLVASHLRLLSPKTRTATDSKRQPDSPPETPPGCRKPRHLKSAKTTWPPWPIVRSGRFSSLPFQYTRNSTPSQRPKLVSRDVNDERATPHPTPPNPLKIHPNSRSQVRLRSQQASVH